MPPKGKLPAAVIADIERWIADGAIDPRVAGETKTAGIDFEKAKHFWSFAKPKMPKRAPTSRTPPGPRRRGSLIRFILAKLESEGLQPAELAEPRTLIRRVTFDLTGLPPTPEEVDAFLADKSPDAYAKLVDRLLSSPHYGERHWGRYWLDVARFAEDQAHTFGVKPNTQAYRYRDWVIQAFNDDMPYDRFVKLQIAADVIAMPEEERIKQLPALGFFGLGAQYYKNTDAAKAAADELDDRIDTLSRAFLGLTVSCARCHDHKFDPIPQQDYYSLAGIFSSSKLADVQLAPKAVVAKYQEGQSKLKKIDDGQKAFLKDGASRRSPSATFEDTAPVSARRVEDAARGSRSQAKDVAKAEGHLEVEHDRAGLRRVLAEAAEGGRVRRLPQDAGGERVGARSDDRSGRKGNPDGCRCRDGSQGRQEDEQEPGGSARRLLRRQRAVHGDGQRHQESASRREESQARRVREGVRQRQESVSDERPLRRRPMASAEGTPADMKVFLRGNPAKLGDVAPRRFLHVLAPGADPKPFTHGSGQLDLRRRRPPRPDNPLTARVIVNRIWQRHFGRGIVGTRPATSASSPNDPLIRNFSITSRAVSSSRAGP